MTLVAIDGPGGSGKSTVARALAERLGWPRLDTGAMYRALALKALRSGVDPADGAALGELAHKMQLSVDDEVRLDGEDVTAAIRSPEVDAVVSQVSAHQQVRHELVERQRHWAFAHGTAVVEGRDIGSVVLPGAELKVYLDAHPEVRAARRAGQRGEAQRREVASALAARDAYDQGRATSPLLVADGALVIDSSEIGVEEVLDQIQAALAARGVAVDVARAGSQAVAGEPGTPGASTRGATTVSRRPGGATVVRPATRGDLAFYAACRFIAVGLSRIVFPGPVLGAERLPTSGAFVLAPSHRSYVDWLIAARVTRRRLRYLVKGEVWRSRAVGRLLEALGAFPVHRGTPDRVALNSAIAVLGSGEPLVVFPEGTRQRGDEIATLQEGAAYLALRARVPIYPVGLGFTEKAMPRGSSLPRPTSVRIVVGEAISPDEVLSDAAPGQGGRVPRSATHAMTALLRERLQRAFDEAERRSGA